MKSKVRIFCDFDGTVAKHDVGYRIFHHFSQGKNAQFIPAWKSGSMSSREILTREAELVDASQKEIIAFLEDFDLDHAFADFVSACELSGFPITILSDGLSFYIEQILSRHMLGHLPVVSNIGHMRGRRLEIEFPHDNKSCKRCGNCKGERIREIRQTHESENLTIVFVGDGYSDLCAVSEADILFAKKDLATYCAERQIVYTPYHDFSDVAAHLRTLGLLPQQSRVARER